MLENLSTEALRAMRQEILAEVGRIRSETHSLKKDLLEKNSNHYYPRSEWEAMLIIWREKSAALKTLEKRLSAQAQMISETIEIKESK